MITWLSAAEAAIVVGYALAASLVGAPVVGWILRLVDRAENARLRRELPGWDDHADLPEGVVAAAARLRGGTWIGILERLAVFAAVVAGFPAGIAVVVAIKGLARYPELQNPSTDAAQRFIIGTFASVLLACACAGLAVWTTWLF